MDRADSHCTKCAERSRQLALERGAIVDQVNTSYWEEVDRLLAMHSPAELLAQGRERNGQRVDVFPSWGISSPHPQDLVGVQTTFPAWTVAQTPGDPPWTYAVLDDGLIVGGLSGGIDRESGRIPLFVHARLVSEKRRRTINRTVVFDSPATADEIARPIAEQLAEDAASESGLARRCGWTRSDLRPRR